MSLGFWPCKLGKPVVAKMWYSDAVRVPRAIEYYLEHVRADPELLAAEATPSGAIPHDGDELEIDTLDALRVSLYHVAMASHSGQSAAVGDGLL